MKKFDVSNSIFDRLLSSPNINLAALQQLSDIANSNPALNAYLSQAVSAGDVKFRLATEAELKAYGAGAFFDYDVTLRANDRNMAIALDPAWLVGDSAFIATGGVNRSNVAGMLTHEFDHYMRVDQLRATDGFADLGKDFPNLTSAERFEARPS